jgi:hypothetical protein
LDLFLRLDKGHSACYIPVTAEKQAPTCMFDRGSYDANEFSVHLNEILVEFLVNSWRTYLGDNGMQVIPLREAARLFGIQELVAHEDRAVTDVAGHGGVCSRPWWAVNVLFYVGDGLCEGL